MLTQKRRKHTERRTSPESSLWRTQASRRPLKRSLSFGDWEEVPVPRKGRQGSSAQPQRHRRVGLGARGTLGTRRPGHGTALSHPAVGGQDARRPRHRSPRGCFRAQTPSQRGDVSFPAAARLRRRHPHSSRTRRDDERSCVSQAHIINDFDQFRAQFGRARRPVRGQSARRPSAAGSKDDSGPRLSSVKGTLAYFLRGFVFNKHG